MKIAVVGGGIAGLVAAWLLARGKHEVALFERHAQPGFTASSVAVPGPGAELRVDVPLRVFYPGYYPTLVRLYAELGVATQPVSYATTFTGDDGAAYFRWRNLRLGGLSVPYVLPRDVATPRGRRVLAGALHFHRVARAALAGGALGTATVAEFVAAERVAPEFVQGLLLPTIATVGTCTTQDALAYPAAAVAGYLAQGVAHHSVRRALHGADDVARRLLAGVPRVLCSAGVQGLKRRGGGVLLQRQGQADERFDHVVLATQANQALALWKDATPAEAAVLRAFRYRPLDVLMHTDASLMPPRRADWSPVNARVSEAHERPESTIWINAVQPALRGAPPLLQTVQPQRQPRDELVVGRARFERPLLEAGSAAALARLKQLQAEAGRRVWLCGSYAEAGVPLLESAVRSAYAVADALAKATPAAAPAGREALTSP